MGVAYFIAFENGDEEVCSEVDGKILARAEKQLNKIAKSLGLKGLDEYFGMSEDMLEEFDIEPEQAGPWFDPDEGIRWFQTIIAHITHHPKAIKNAARIVEELNDFKAVLMKAKQAGTKWHIGIDI